ncbi:hypothetical protein GCM10011344_39770 [Dokdonia pacifica]|uniref:Uncharacterized protein n=1 Tax=Dokdonia pacifica TaxID=1627892 RepID=A0A239A5H5_9FLAO|nr:hypothetical protein [Dokdonia pacifica]GGG35035.1 hypothetical protein GCM10011344_39770 [Dokdonia pacifica]SNR90759.1 hypothetical protein SAMN06265376_104160 [Dokdonia pacifica]
MKKIITTLFVLIASILIFSFTVNPKEETSYRSIQELSSDARFIGLLQDQLQLVNKAKDLKTLASYDSKESLSNADINKISTLAGYKSRADYERALKSKIAVIKSLEKDYNISKYSKSQLNQIGLTTMNSRNFKAALPVIIDDGDVGGNTNECLELCADARTACYAVATTAAVAAHIGCGAADVTVILGIACHTAVLAAQAAALHQCDVTYAQCVNGC